MLPEMDKSNLAYDLSHFDNTARREQQRQQDRERREREIKMNRHSASRSGSKLGIVLFAVGGQCTEHQG